MRDNIEEFKSLRDIDLAFFDLEFSGLDFSHEIIEIGVIIVDHRDFKIEDEISMRVKMRHPEKADAESLKMAGYDDELWKDAYELKDALKILAEKTHGLVFVGFNYSLDWARLEKAFFDCGMQAPYFRRKLDVLSMAYSRLYGDKKIKAFALSELCRYFDIPRGRPHSALDDALAAYQIFVKLMDYEKEK